MVAKELRWELWWKQNEGHREAAKTPFGVTYHVSAEGWWFPLCELNPCDGIEAAKIAAQDDFEAKTRACLKP